MSAGGVSVAPFCGIRGGSLDKADNRYTSADITNLRAGRHDCFDRLVIDLGPKVTGLPGADASGYTVRYVSQITDDPSGEPVPVSGGAFLSVFVNARAHTDEFEPTYQPADRMRAVNVSGFATFRQVAFLGTFEGITQIGLGVRARLPFRVFMLSGQRLTPGDRRRPPLVAPGAAGSAQPSRRCPGVGGHLDEFDQGALGDSRHGVGGEASLGSSAVFGFDTPTGSSRTMLTTRQPE